MTAPLACRICATAYEPIGASHTHDGCCPQCQRQEQDADPVRRARAVVRKEARRAFHAGAKVTFTLRQLVEAGLSLDVIRAVVMSPERRP